jgi:hypothetical protein
MAICTIKNCDGEVLARGLCPKHYRRWERHGDVTKGDPQSTPQEWVINVLTRGPILDWHDPDFHEPDPEFNWDELRAAWERHRDLLPQDCWAARHFEKSA